MGTATEAINALPLPEAQRALYVSHIAVADAVCYLFGSVFVILFCSQIGPRLLRIDLKAEALDARARNTASSARRPGCSPPGAVSSCGRTALPDDAPVAGERVSAAEARVPDHRLFVQRIRRGDDIIEAEPGRMLQAGDVVAISGPREVLVELLGRGPQEVEDRQLLDVPVATVQVLLTNRDLAGRTLADLAQGRNGPRHLYLRAITRGGAGHSRRARYHARARRHPAGGRARDGGDARRLPHRLGDRADDDAPIS